jgi:hypothetical protein
MPSNGLKRSQKRWREYQKRRQEQNWSHMAYYDKVHVGDMVEPTIYTVGDNKLHGLVIATADTVEHPPEWGDTYVLWSGSHEPAWEDCGALEVISEIR